MEVKSRKYIPRVVDEQLRLCLESSGAVLIEGAKWCGKTTSAKQVANSVVDLGDPDKEDEYFALAAIAPSKLLDGNEPLLIDEWQRIPKLWDSVRTLVDRKGGFGHYILTGSATPLSKMDEASRRHSGTGRISSVRMRPFSLFESGDSNGMVSLSALFSGEDAVQGSNPMDINRLAFLCCRGGWPEVCIAENIRDRAALMVAQSYVDSICSGKFEDEDGIVRDKDKMALFLRAYARTVGSQQSIADLCKDLSFSGTFSFSEKSAYSYHKSLRDIFAIEDMPAWNANLRSKTAIRTSDTRYFSDPSIAAGSLGVGTDDLIKDIRTFGFIFENLCMRDLRVYCGVNGGKVFHYRDKSGLECDAVIHLPNGKFGLVEIKLGGKEAIEHGAKTLIKLAGKIDGNIMGEPSFMMVLIGVGAYAYRREDGVFVVPISMLGP